jgi:Cytosolic carboxypeptidase N-terminal domain
VRPSVATNSRGVYINSNFDSGNIDVVSMEDVNNIQLSIHEDPYCDTDGRSHFQCAATCLGRIAVLPASLSAP